MIVAKKTRIELDVDASNQWFASIWVKVRDRHRRVRFKIDTGCNAVILSHGTLKKLGFSTAVMDLAKLPSMTGKLASGETTAFKQIGKLTLYKGSELGVPICEANAICHATHNTNDLLGTEVFKQFANVKFKLSGKQPYMELLVPIQ